MNTWLAVLTTAVIAVPGSLLVISLAALRFARRFMERVPEEGRCHALLTYESSGSTRRCVYAEGHVGPHYVPEDDRFYEAHWNS